MNFPWWLDELLYLLGGLSILGLIATFVLTPIVIVALPEDYFESTKPVLVPPQGHPVLRAALRVAKNLVGIVLLVSGAAMLFIPGPGLLTILFGLILTDVPGKRRVEQRIAAVPVLRRAVDAVRRRAGKPPFRLPTREASGAAPARQVVGGGEPP